MSITPLSIEPRGLKRELAARYVGVGLTKFDEMVNDGRMPTPKRIDGRKLWDKRALDSFFENLPEETPPNDWDEKYGT